nr:MAG TPA: hypothetical protein [Caudoviricetes sp.]
MAKRHKKTPTERAYSKQVRRIKQFISRAEKRGFHFNENVLPKRPNRITQASVRKLAKLTPDKLYEKAEYAGALSYGEIVPSIEGLKLERSARANKGAETKKYKLAHPTQEPTNTKGFIPPENISEDTSFFDAVVISGFKAHVRQFNEHASNLLLSWLDKILATNDVHDVATMLNDGAEAGLIVTYQIVYSQDKLTQYMSEMLDYLPEAGELFKAEMMDAMEEEEDYSSPL